MDPNLSLNWQLTTDNFSKMFDFRAPLFLILLAVIPLLILVQRSARLSTVKWRKKATFILRGAALLCAILALANLHRTHKEQRLAVAFLLDTSESIPRSQHEEARKQIKATVEKLKPTDQFGIIGFAKETSVLLEIRQKQDHLLDSASTVSLETFAEQTARRDGTDILAALKRAIAQLPDNHHRRIVLFSDGMHNAGGIPLMDYLPLLSASNMEILTVPLDAVNDAVRVVHLQVPTQVRKGQSFEIRAVIETDGSIPTLTATLYHQGVPINTLEWTLSRGTHPFTLPVPPISTEGNHRYTLQLNVTDEVPENNEGYGVVKLADKPHALYIENDLAHATYLETVLQENGFEVEVMSPSEMPTELVELQRSDVLILSNVSAETLSTEQLRSIENYVGDLGHGLVVIGGERAYGPGGYTDTVLERVLPVEMTPRERKDAVAIVFVLDTSGSMANYVEARQKIGLAIEGVRAGIRNLDEEDVAGILGFNTEVHTISDLTSEHRALRQVVGRLKPTGGTTKMKDAIERAYEMLEANDAKRKYIVLLSDGKSRGAASDFLALAERIAEARIRTTTIAIGDENKELLSQFAEIGGGSAVFVKNVQLPAVLTEAVRETQHYTVQEPFQPVIVSPDEPIVADIGTPPLLYGYVATTEKETAQVLIRSHKEEPILAAWNFGLGKAIAWTSDAKPAWSKAWIPWHNFGKFWGQVINWTVPAADAGSDFDLVVSANHGVGEVNIDTRTPSEASYRVHVVAPDGTNEIVEIQQLTPTRYNGTFQMQDSGSYIVTAQREGDAHQQIEVLSLPYPAEYAEFGTDTALLKMLVAGTAGIHEPTPTQIATPAGTPIERQMSLAQALLVAAALLFVLEMILRRFSITHRLVGAISESRLFVRFRRKPAISPAGIHGTPTPSDAIPPGERAPESTTSPQPAETSMNRLLAAKRRVR